MTDDFSMCHHVQTDTGHVYVVTRTDLLQSKIQVSLLVARVACVLHHILLRISGAGAPEKLNKSS